MRAIIVDDSSSMRSLLADLLRERDHDVDTAGSAEEALRRHAQSPYELMLVDWTLPGLSGLDLCRAVRGRRGGDDVVLLVVTGRNRPEDLVQVLDAGATDYLSKPIDPELLQTRLMVAERGARQAERRRDAERALEASEVRIAELVRNLPGVAFHAGFDTDGAVTFRFVSKGARAVLGHPGNDPMQALEDRVPRGARDALTSAFERSARTLEPVSIVTEIAHTDGSRREVHVMARPSREADGSIAFDGLMIDVTAEHEAQRARNASEEAFRSLIEGTPDAVFVLREGFISYANPQARRFLALPPSARIDDLPLGDFLDEARDEALRESREQSVERRGPSAPRELHFRRHDGQRVVGEATAMAITYADGPATLIVVRDLTERRELQHRLQLADRMASVGTLAAGVAHELNNPLSYVLSSLQLAREELADCPSGERIQTIGQLLDDGTHGAERMRDIVRDLKTFSRVDDEVYETVDVLAVLESSIAMCWNELRHRASLERQLSEVPPVAINASRLGQVFLNLLINAIQALPEAGAQRIIVRSSVTAEGAVSVDVQDSGIGIPEDQIGQVFDPFFTTKESGEGTGLGLSICHNIVSAAGGRIRVASTPGEGTVFTVELPAAAQAVSAPNASPRPSVAGGPAGDVVVIDDDALVGRSLRRALRGHRVTLFTSGEDGVAHLLAHPETDLVFCDLMMPVMSGMDVFEAISEVAPNLAERFVFMTGGAFTPRARAFANADARRCLEKPFDVDVVRAIADEAARRER